MSGLAFRLVARLPEITGSHMATTRGQPDENRMGQSAAKQSLITPLRADYLVIAASAMAWRLPTR